MRAWKGPPQTWHYGLVARWWAEFNDDLRPHEIPYFRRFVERGQPALDGGCGTGRLLLPFLRAGLDVDGCDVSADMIALCREKAAREGLSPSLFVQAMHELEPPRRYRPYADARQWGYWPQEARGSLPEAAKPPRDRKRASDGSELALRSRIVELDPLVQRVTLEMHAELWRDGTLQAEEDHLLNIGLYFRNELLLMLERAGFTNVVVQGDHNDAEATSDDEFILFVARK